MAIPSIQGTEPWKGKNKEALQAQYLPSYLHTITGSNSSDEQLRESFHSSLPMQSYRVIEQPYNNPQMVTTGP